MSDKELDKSDSDDSLNFDYNGIEDEILENEQNIDEKNKINEEEKIINSENNNNELINNEKEEESQSNDENKNINNINDENIEAIKKNNIGNDILEQNNIENNNDNDDSTIINSNSQSYQSLEKTNSIKKENQEINDENNQMNDENKNDKYDNNGNDNNTNINNNDDTNNISEDEKNKLLQKDMLKEIELEQIQNEIYINQKVLNKNKNKNDKNKNLLSDDGPHITILYNNGFISKKYIRNDIVKKDFLENVLPKDIKFKNGKKVFDDSSLPNVKGFHKPNPIKTYIYRMNHNKDEINIRKEKIASCYLLTLGHSFPLGHDTRQYQNYYYTKDRNTFTKNYINTTKSKIKQNTEFYHKYIDFDYELPSIISNLPYKTYLDFYNSDSYSPQLRRSSNNKYYFVNNISNNSNNRKDTTLKIPDIRNKNINNKTEENIKFKSNRNDYKRNSLHKLNQNYINSINNGRVDTYQSPIIRIKKNNEKLQKIKEVDIIMNQNKINVPYNSKFILSS